MKRSVPLLSPAVAEGAASGRFKVSHPEETVEAILSALFWQFHQPGLNKDLDKLNRVEHTLARMLDRMLGVADNTFAEKLNLI